MIIAACIAFGISVTGLAATGGFMIGRWYEEGKWIADAHPEPSPVALDLDWDWPMYYPQSPISIDSLITLASDNFWVHKVVGDDQ